MDAEADLQRIYLNNVSEALGRARACEAFLSAYTSSQEVYTLEAAVLQARKSLECVVFPAIAPNKTAYEWLRLSAEEPADFRRDFNARKILQLLSEINADFYPIALLSPAR